MNRIELITATLLTMALVSFSTTSRAQAPDEKPLSVKHEFSIYGMTGYSSLLYDLNPEAISANDGKTYSAGNDLTGGIGIGYTYSFSSKVGLATGLEFASFATTTNVENLSGRSQEGYSYGSRREEMFFHSEISRYKETQSTRYLHIPLLVEYRMQDDEEKYRWFMAAGAKFGFSLSGKYKSKADRLTTYGYFPETNQTFRNMPEHGFLTITNPSWDGSQKQGFNVSLSAEAGLRINLTDKWRHWRLYTGIYIDYGLTNVSPPKTNAALVGYNNSTPEIFAYNSIITAKQPSTDLIYVDKINLIAIGVKMKLGFRK
jgi:hypothetical protein